MEELSKSSYGAYIFCTNCHIHKKIEINKGLKIEDINCPNCANKTLKIDPNGEIFNRPHQREDYR